MASTHVAQLPMPFHHNPISIVIPNLIVVKSDYVLCIWRNFGEDFGFGAWSSSKAQSVVGIHIDNGYNYELIRMNKLSAIRPFGPGGHFRYRRSGRRYLTTACCRLDYPNHSVCLDD